MSPAHWFLVIGQDQFAGLHTWLGFQELLSRVTLAVAQTPRREVEPMRACAPQARVDCRCRRWTSATDIRVRVARRGWTSLRWCRLRWHAIFTNTACTGPPGS